MPVIESILKIAVLSWVIQLYFLVMRMLRFPLDEQLNHRFEVIKVSILVQSPGRL